MKIKSIIFSVVAMCFGAIVSVAQVPEAMRFQSVVRDANGKLIKDKAVGVQITLFDGSNHTDLYSETFEGETDGNGVVNVEFGTGVVNTELKYKNFEDIDWSCTVSAPLWMRVSIDPTGGTDYSIVSGDVVKKRRLLNFFGRRLFCFKSSYLEQVMLF